MGRDDQTLRPTIVGNDLFQAAVKALGLDAGPTSLIMQTTLTAGGTSPMNATLDDIGMLLPEIERRVRLLAPPDVATAAMKRLRTFMLNYQHH
jgi:hypothetical protein